MASHSIDGVNTLIQRSVADKLRESTSRFSVFLDRSIEWKIHWVLRLGIFMEFVGHGACGVNTKAAWLPYFHVFGISDGAAWRLMPLIGSMDITLGLAALFSPRRALLLYMAVWGGFTALLRPAAGEGWWEFIERAYNFGVPLALLILHGLGKDWKSWFESLRTIPELSGEQVRKLLWTFRVIAALMLIGHGGYGPFMGKANLLTFYRAAGLASFGLPLEMIRAGVGFLEMGLGILALFSTWPGFFVFVCLWKVVSESLFIASGSTLACWEVVERGGSYVAPLGAVLALIWVGNFARRGPSQRSKFVLDSR